MYNIEAGRAIATANGLCQSCGAETREFASAVADGRQRWAGRRGTAVGRTGWTGHRKGAL